MRALVCGNNYDAAALYHTYHELLAQPESKKIMFVLSDGMPSTFCPAERPTRDMIAEIEADSRVRLFGMGIRHDTSGFYSMNANVDNVKDLAEKVFEELSIQIK
jgi:cobaltochelatase CobT